MGAPERDFDMATSATAGEVILLCEQGGTESAVWGSLAVAVNQEYAGRERVLVEGDEVALLPPVSGGTARESPDVERCQGI